MMSRSCMMLPKEISKHPSNAVQVGMAITKDAHFLSLSDKRERVLVWGRP